MNGLDAKFRKKWWGCSLVKKALQKRGDLSWSLKAEKNLVSQGKAEKKTFYVREQSEQRWAWKKAKECLVTGNGGARRPGQRFLCQRLQGNKAGWVGWSQKWRILNAILRIWAYCSHEVYLIRTWQGGEGVLDKLKREGRGYGQSTSAGKSWQSVSTIVTMMKIERM